MEFLTDITCWSLFKGFELCQSLARVLIKVIFPLVKWHVDRTLTSLGVNVEGRGPLGIEVHNETEFYLRLAVGRHFGLFEAHMDKVCTINDIKAFAIRGLKTGRNKEYLHPFSNILGWFNLQTRSKVWQVGIEHYDVGNDIYESMLDKNMHNVFLAMDHPLASFECKPHRAEKAANGTIATNPITFPRTPPHGGGDDADWAIADLMPFGDVGVLGEYTKSMERFHSMAPFAPATPL
ncbi:Cyclopropane-fatty-acyl-phospholipid synthase [Folsomia candida]|uniref:Cyclopropane-fatty-acyl-phospholipid synthase n=1 Tax=Folsomia candida TaxID=158441 RepID=A0A226E7Y8_FOLCA|nr:Cyclopropane-fatty-acyl-phospholipid synthase [Folsomia candida]